MDSLLGSLQNGLAMVLVALWGFGVAGRAEGRTFTSTDGKTIEAEVVSISGGEAVLKVVNGRKVTIPMERFIEDDRKFLAAWAEEQAKKRIPRVRVTVNTNKTDRREKGAYEDRAGEVRFEVSVLNDERGFDIKGATATVIVIGDYLRYDGDSVVMQRTDFPNLDIGYGQTAVLKAALLRYEYDTDGYRHGEKYSGYVIGLKNSSGLLVYSTGSTARFEKFAEGILKYKKGERFDKNFQKATR